jgi:hypothetical protein
MAEGMAYVLRSQSIVGETYFVRTAFLSVAKPVATFVLVVASVGVLMAAIMTGELWLLLALLPLILIAGLHVGWDEPFSRSLGPFTVPWCFPTSQEDAEERRKRLNKPSRVWWRFWSEP